MHPSTVSSILPSRLALTQDHRDVSGMVRRGIYLDLPLKKFTHFLQFQTKINKNRLVVLADEHQLWNKPMWK